jgi:hypothetical protein
MKTGFFSNCFVGVREQKREPVKNQFPVDISLDFGSYADNPAWVVISTLIFQ